MSTISGLLPIVASLPTQGPAAPSVQVSVEMSAPPLATDSVAVTTRLAAPATSGALVPTAPHKTAASLGALGKLLQVTGDGMSRVGGLGGTAMGAGLGLAANLIIGTGGWMLPVAGALLLGWECADAHSAKQALTAGVSSPEFTKRQQAHQSLSPMSSAAQVLTGVAAMGSIAVGALALGGPVGLVAGVVGGLGLSAALIISGARSEKAVVEAQR